MGIRLTGLSTPVIGAEWEYVDKDIIESRTMEYYRRRYVEN